MPCSNWEISSPLRNSNFFLTLFSNRVNAKLHSTSKLRNMVCKISPVLFSSFSPYASDVPSIPGHGARRGRKADDDPRHEGGERDAVPARCLASGAMQAERRGGAASAFFLTSLTLWVGGWVWGSLPQFFLDLCVPPEPRVGGSKRNRGGAADGPAPRGILSSIRPAYLYLVALLRCPRNHLFLDFSTSRLNRLFPGCGLPRKAPSPMEKEDHTLGNLLRCRLLWILATL